ncbi:MAG: aminotransferase class III-fold pyridoxal phosphate-dependent enzyme, partial [Actinobacteria bacterium]
MRGRVRPAAGQRQQARGDLLVGQLGVGERLQVKPARGDVGREGAQVRAAVAGAHDVLVERLIDARHGPRRREGPPSVRSARTELLDECRHHPHRRRPGTVGRADRLDDVLENGWAPQHPPGAGRDPRELGILACSFVQAGQIGVEPEHVARSVCKHDAVARTDVHALDPGEAWPACADPDRARSASRQRNRRLEGTTVLVEPVRRQVRDAVRRQRPPEIDRLAAGAHELELGRPRAFRHRESLAHRIGTVAVSVLEAEPPRFSPDEAAELAGRLFGVTGTATPLGSERDQAFLIDAGDDGGCVLKISNSGEDPAVLDLEDEAILHVARVDPELPVARAGPAVEADGHLVRLFERMPGQHRGPELAADAVFDYAATHARLNLALRSFFHPAAGRYLLWDLKNAAGLRPLLDSVADPGRRRLLERVLDRYESFVLPRWPRLRAQVVHGDFNLDNVLLDERGRVSGIVDFGDIAHSAQVGDFAVGLASLLRGRPEGDLFRVARIAVDGYASVLPFEQEELDVLGDLVTARLATIVSISAWRSVRYPENAGYIEAWDADSWELLEIFDRLGADEVSYRLGAQRPAAPTAELSRRREGVLGPALTPLTYRRPVHVVRGEGVWLYEADGTRLLDAYNNVPVVGHCHPRVTEAVVRQTRLLNTHARYLYEPLVELGERLVASMPVGSGLDTVMLVNSGSEANELAW